MQQLPDIRSGLGYDVHAFAEGRKLILCGVEISHEKGLLGHSDADVRSTRLPMLCSERPLCAT